MSCDRKPATVAVPQLPKVEIDDVPAPASSSIVVQSGSNLRSIAAAAYGHEDFSGFVARLNGIAAPERLIAGATLKTPSLPIAFRDAGIDPRYQPAINALAMSWNDLQQILPDYTKARDESRTVGEYSFHITDNLRARLVKCADGIDASIAVLNNPSDGHKAPRSSIGQFARVSSSLRSLATGTVGSYDYDTFMLGKGFGLGFTYTLIWIQSHHQ